MVANHAPAPDDSPPAEADYDTILAALTQSARGRWFLQEYLRRNAAAERNAPDTATLLDAIGRIERLLQSRSLEPSVPALADGATMSPQDEFAEAEPVAEDAADRLETPDIFKTDIAVSEIAVRRAIDVDDVVFEDDAVEDIAAEDAAVAETAITRTVVAPTAMATVEPPAIVVADLTASAADAAALAFLGPVAAAAAVETTPQPAATMRREIPIKPDPFADIRALSDIEKIALFT